MIFFFIRTSTASTASQKKRKMIDKEIGCINIYGLEMVFFAGA